MRIVDQLVAMQATEPRPTDATAPSASRSLRSIGAIFELETGGRRYANVLGTSMLISDRAMAGIGRPSATYDLTFGGEAICCHGLGWISESPPPCPTAPMKSPVAIAVL
jgi:hypothetical protein